ncbi:MAG: endonuclease/exonuclease/phosphatase family protein [Ruminococcaceae bacterium]|nr:endonuclease/exonuclease/phosphatase family protein [Oscillospiraceae bacterium]
MKIVTFNLRCDVKIDQANMFKNRKGLILDKIDAEMPDVIGFQEMLPHMREFLIKHLSEYQFVGRSRSADFTGEHMDVAFLKDKYDIIGLDCFWLSPTPDVPGSRYEEQSGCPRIVTATMLREIKTNKMFRFINTHLDHIGEQARVLGIKQIAKYISEQNKRFELPFFLTGDFNALPDSETIKYCYALEEPAMTELTAGITDVTYHGYGTVSENYKIDYIFCDRKTAENSYTVTRWEDCNYGLYLSDHYPICCEIDF